MVEKWYKDGLRFKCTQCGKCCTGGPGFVWIEEKELQGMANQLSISVEEFVRAYTRTVFGKLALLENKTTFDCVFLKDKQCRIYQSRPLQCRKFPWWPENLKSPQAWEEAGAHCEGINHPEAPLISLGEIDP